MFGISGGEIFVVLLLVVMLFGANKIPELAKSFGKGMREIRNAANDIKQDISSSIEDETLTKFKDKVEKEKKEIEDIAGSIKRNIDL
jgi:sec-independent protein translocase protein TatA